MGGADIGGAVGSPWLPDEALPGTRPEDFARVVGYLRYCVVDEIVEDRAMIVTCPWPFVDDEDRRVFPDREPDDGFRGDDWEDPYEEVGVAVATLQEFLGRRRPGGEVDANRRVTIGDVYMMSMVALSLLKREEAGETASPALTPAAPLVVDVTRSARAAARSAFSRIVAPPSDSDGSPVGHGGGEQGRGPFGAAAGPPSGWAPAGGAAPTVLPQPPWIPDELSAGLALAAQFTAALTGQPPTSVVGRTVAALRYCVVDEVVGERVGLLVTAWPTIDPEGRRTFPGPADGDTDDGGYREVGLALGRLQEFLDWHRLPDGGRRDRPVRVGDVFAMTAGALESLERRTRGEGERPEHVLDRLAVVDITRSARAAAKAAFARIVAAEERWTSTRPRPDDEDDDPGSATPASGPDAPRGSGPPAAGSGADTASREELAAGVDALVTAAAEIGPTTPSASAQFIRLDVPANDEEVLHAAWELLSDRWHGFAMYHDEESAVMALGALSADRGVAAVLRMMLAEQGGGPEEHRRPPEVRY